ncbi:TrkA C-terminal domain-containing protein [Rubritalea tangerina]|uniref:TrkA C-terminal domain-containing protein n=2 Tax=Rubritalea tangerina TaxID=430798 RepID=A0ABW4ZDA3_9BACT
MLSLLVVRLGTNALMLTGMSREAATFQSASAFFGVGFTTAEAEMVMRHSIRRKIVLRQIIAGNIGLTSALATLVVTFVQNDNAADGMSHWLQLLLTVFGIASLAFLLNLKVIKKPVDTLLMRSLQSSGMVRVCDYELLLRVEEGFSVSEVKVNASHPWCGRKLMESRPSDFGVVVLNVRHVDGRFTGAPDKDFRVQEGDELMIYGADADVARVANNLKHAEDHLARGVI